MIGAVMMPGEPDLQGMLEAELTWQPVGQEGRLGHHETNEVVGQQINPDLLLCHCWRFAAQASPVPQGGVVHVQPACHRLR